MRRAYALAGVDDVGAAQLRAEGQRKALHQLLARPGKAKGRATVRYRRQGAVRGVSLQTGGRRLQIAATRVVNAKGREGSWEGGADDDVKGAASGGNAKTGWAPRGKKRVVGAAREEIPGRRAWEGCAQGRAQYNRVLEYLSRYGIR